MDTDMVNFASFIVTELQNMCIKDQQLFISGKMQGSIAAVVIEEDFIDVVIATDYASYTNTRGRMAGWIERTVDRCCRAFAEKNNVENEMLEGTIYYGG